MPSHDRPYFDSQRERDRGYRERDSSFARRRYGRRDDDDDRGPWISRDREPFEPEFDPRENEFRERRRFEQFEDWERPRELPADAGYRRSFGGAAYGYGYSSGGAYGSSFRGRHAPEGRYAGRGPKGYQRSDERLKEEACEQLTADPDVDASEVEVSVQNGEVTLEGTVPTRNMKRAAEDCIEAISGVQQVHNRLRVESTDFGRDEGQFSARGEEGQRSSAGRKAH